MIKIIIMIIITIIIIIIIRGMKEDEERVKTRK
jgi:hypothetical protein